MRPALHLFSARVAALAAAMLLAACAQPDAAPTSSPTETGPSPGAPVDTTATATATAADADDALALRRVSADQVCMRSNRFLGKPQLSTEVEGRAYFGCCAGCTRGLSADAAARTATDPVTGRPVDKATAVIGARPDGRVVYFESDETFARGQRLAYIE